MVCSSELRVFPLLLVCLCFLAGAGMQTHAAMTWPPSAYSYVDPVFTAYNPDGSVDYRGIPAYAKQSVDNGVNVILLGGSTAEWPSLTSEERLNLLKAWRSAVNDLPVPVKPQVIFHAGDISIANAQYLASRAKDAGADAILIVAPCIMAPATLESLVATIRVIAMAAPDMPAMYYHYPDLYHVNFNMNDFLTLAADPVSGIPTLAGVKFIDSDMATLNQASGVSNSTFTLFNNDPLLAGMATGSKGAISYTNIYPLVKELYTAFKSNDMKTARAIQRDILAIDNVINVYGGKSAARNLPMLFGGPSMGAPRPPLVAQTKEQLAAFAEALQAIGFLPKKHVEL